ncbi:TPA: hypothetical protein DEP94_01175 [Candidatus Nomurabacteria bacterium]|nr:hypothetical protein [Candidatus Nomurabacteria bacterium]
MNIMGSSIQDYAKKINSRLSFWDILSVSITTLALVIFAIFLYIKKGKENIPVSYISNSENNAIINKADSRPFASVNGKTYTFSWCGGSNNISEKNKIYFSDEQIAKNSGRVLSKLCQK